MSFLNCCNDNTKAKGNTYTTNNDSSLAQRKESGTNSDKTVVKQIKLNYGFIIKLGAVDDLQTFIVYDYLELYHNGILVFSDTTNEYDLSNKLYPMIVHIDSNTNEILLETNERPNENLAEFLKIQNDKLTEKKQLPIFEKDPDKLSDGSLEYYGHWDNNEVWEKDGQEETGYNPALYYLISQNGIMLDSARTKAENIEIYGEFKGYDYNQKITYPTKKLWKK